MLAYVFWHWPFPQLDRQSYEKNLIAFHEILKATGPAGFHFSATFRLPNAPWTGHVGETYEDWYVVENSAALDILNDAAISGVRKVPHDASARGAMGGIAGLYRLRFGEPKLMLAHEACWFAKPAGMSYEEFNRLVQPEVESAGSALWGRQMTLGPTSEFCWHSTGASALPDLPEVNKIPLDLVWSGQ